MIVYATVPFLAAGVSYLWIGERPNRRVLVASGDRFDRHRPDGGCRTQVAGRRRQRRRLRHDLHLRRAARDGTPLSGAPDGAGQLRGVPRSAHWCSFRWPRARSRAPMNSSYCCCSASRPRAGAYVLFLIGGRYIPSGEAGLIGMLDVGAVAALGLVAVRRAAGQRRAGRRRDRARRRGLVSRRTTARRAGRVRFLGDKRCVRTQSEL